MKNPILRFLGLSITFIIIIYTWRSDGTTKKEYWENFDVLEGKLQGPTVVATVADYLYINGEAWGLAKDALHLGDQAYIIDSLRSTFAKNQLKHLRDTLYENTAKEWNRSKKMFESLAWTIDTFIQVRNKKIPILMEQKPVFQVAYRISIEGDDRYVEISPYDYEDLEQWKYGEETPLAEFIKYQNKVDSQLGEDKQLQITVLKNGTSNWRNPYIICNSEGDELLYNQSGFERLQYKSFSYTEPNEKFILWYDNWVVKFIIVVFSIVIFISFIQIFTTTISDDEDAG